VTKDSISPLMIAKKGGGSELLVSRPEADCEIIP
jgi:hypothetical protein